MKTLFEIQTASGVLWADISTQLDAIRIPLEAQIATLTKDNNILTACLTGAGNVAYEVAIKARKKVLAQAELDAAQVKFDALK